jgi:DNA-binding NarL/FixJ family response regulator
MIRVLVADDHTLVRRSISALLDKAPDIEVVGEAKDGHEAVDLARKLEPDLVIMDVSMPRMDGLAATARIHLDHLSSKVIILSMYANRSLVQQALRNGAMGYVLKRTVTDELVPAIYQVLQGEVFLSHVLTSQTS